MTKKYMGAYSLPLVFNFEAKDDKEADLIMNQAIESVTKQVSELARLCNLAPKKLFVIRASRLGELIDDSDETSEKSEDQPSPQPDGVA